MTKREIKQLGLEGGKSDVDEFHTNLCREPDDDGVYPTDEEIRARLKATLTPGHLSWDEGARNAGAAELNRVFGARNVERYYTAYNRGAEARIRELTA